MAFPLVVSGALGLPIEDVSYLVCAAIFVSGIATFIQAKGIGPVGAKLPCVMGTDFTFVAPSIAVGSTMGMAGVFGGTILGSFIEIILSRFIKPLMKYFPPVVTGTVVTLIGLTLLPVSMDWAAVAIGLGLGVTVRPDIIVNLPEGLKTLFSSGISTGTIAALILNITLKEEKVA